jgi:hypothetical protein
VPGPGISDRQTDTVPISSDDPSSLCELRRGTQMMDDGGIRIRESDPSPSQKNGIMPRQACGSGNWQGAEAFEFGSRNAEVGIGRGQRKEEEGRSRPGTSSPRRARGLPSTCAQAECSLSNGSRIEVARRKGSRRQRVEVGRLDRIAVGLKINFPIVRVESAAL